MLIEYHHPPTYGARLYTVMLVRSTLPPLYEQVLQTAQASAGPAHVTSRRAPPQSQAPTRAITRDVSTTDRGFEGCESSNAIMISQNRVVIPWRAEVLVFMKVGEAVATSHSIPPVPIRSYHPLWTLFKRSERYVPMCWWQGVIDDRPLIWLFMGYVLIEKPVTECAPLRRESVLSGDEGLAISASGDLLQLILALMHTGLPTVSI